MKKPSSGFKQFRFPEVEKVRPRLDRKDEEAIRTAMMIVPEGEFRGILRWDSETGPHVIYILQKVEHTCEGW